MILDNRGNEIQQVVTHQDLAERSNQAARRLWRRHRQGIMKTTPAATKQPQSYQRGFAMGVACLTMEFHKAGVDVSALLEQLKL